MAFGDCKRRVSWVLHRSDQERVFPNQYFDHVSVQFVSRVIDRFMAL